MGSELHTCVDCGVADDQVLGPDGHILDASHASDWMCIQALRRDNSAKDAEIAALREREGRVAVAFGLWVLGNTYQIKNMESAFAAFRQSDAYPK